MTDNPRADNRDQFRDWDAAYVLGMLGSDDRRAFERHLSTCPSCAAAVAELAGLPGILSVLSPTEAVALEKTAPADRVLATDLVQRLASSVQRSRRLTRVRISVVLAAAAVVAIGGVVVGTAILPGTTPQGTVSQSAQQAMDQVRPGELTAQLAVTPKGWGTRFDWSCTYLNDAWSSGGSAPSYDLVVTTAGGEQIVVATWLATKGTAQGLVASTSTRAGDIRSVEIRPSGSATDLVRSTL